MSGLKILFFVCEKAIEDNRTQHCTSSLHWSTASGNFSGQFQICSGDVDGFSLKKKIHHKKDSLTSDWSWSSWYSLNQSTSIVTSLHALLEDKYTITAEDVEKKR